MSNFPDWWLQAIAIEYLECRDFTKGDRLGLIDFSLVKKSDLDKALKEYKIVSYGTLIHNVAPEVFQVRTLHSLFNPVTKPIVNGDEFAVQPHGIVSNTHFPFLGNPIDVVDPIESFGSHIQVFDGEDLYQWKIAKFEGVQGRNYGRWVSDYVDLKNFDSTYAEFQDLMRLRHQNFDEYLKGVKAYVDKIKGYRSKVFNELLDVHEALKKENSSRKKIVQYRPPLLSNFETMEIRDGEIFTIFSAAPIFYRAALKHRHVAEEIYNKNKQFTAHILDEIYEERIQAIIMAMTCLEAVVNEIGTQKFSELWSSLEKLSLIDKMKFIFKFSESSKSLDTASEPFQGINKMISARNELIHFKHSFNKVKVLNGCAVSKMALNLDQEIIEKIPMNLKGAITLLYEVSNLDVPKWIDKQPGWEIKA